MQELALGYQVGAAELDSDIAIHCERDLVVSILAFMRAGAGGERFVASSDIIERFAARFKKAITLGGTSVRAAIAMRKLGYTSALHLITQNEHVRRLIPADSPFVCSNEHDTLHPHLIVQFDTDDRVRAGDIDTCADRPNRLIYHCNADRIAMKISPDFAGLIGEAQVLLISGFNAMQSESLLLERLATLERVLDALPSSAHVFLEDGGYYAPALRRLVLRTLAPRLSIYSMNEDELMTQLGRGLDLGDAAAVAAAVADLQARLGIPALVVHTQHWALACGAGAREYQTALRAGITMATTRFRHGDDFTLAQYHAMARKPPPESAAQFAAALNADDRLCCAPVPQVRQDDATTIGLGDAFVGGFLPALLS